MGITIATWAVRVLGIYVLIGVLFAIPFLLKGVSQIDPVAKDATRGFRIIILPGVIALWPLLLRRWLGGQKHPPEECNAHRRLAKKGSP